MIGERRGSIAVGNFEERRLRDAGGEDRLIAEIVGVEPEALVTLMQVAEAKLATAQTCERGRG